MLKMEAGDWGALEEPVVQITSRCRELDVLPESLV